MIWADGQEWGTATEPLALFANIVGWTLTGVAAAMLGTLAWMLWDALRGRWRS